MWAAANGHENFCTEAMAAAVRHDLGAPRNTAHRLQVLQRILGAVSDPSVASTFPQARGLINGARVVGLETQVQLGRGSGILDMRLSLDVGELWIEVKTGSPEGGPTGIPDALGATMPPDVVNEARRQLDIYRDRALELSAGDRIRRSVILLAPTRLGREDVPWLSWTAVRRAIVSADDPSPAWRDLAQHLEDSHVIDDQHDPIRAAEAASLVASAGLYRKVMSILWEVHENEIRGQGLPTWRSKAYLLNAVMAQVELGSLIASIGRGLPGRIQWGVVDRDGEAWWVVSIRDGKLGGALTRKLLALWDAGPGLAAAGWSWIEAVQEPLFKVTRVVTTGDHDSAVLWFHTAFEELREHGVIALMAPRIAPTATA